MDGEGENRTPINRLRIEHTNRCTTSPYIIYIIKLYILFNCDLYNLIII